MDARQLNRSILKTKCVPVIAQQSHVCRQRKLTLQFFAGYRFIQGAAHVVAFPATLYG